MCGSVSKEPSLAIQNVKRKKVATWATSPFYLSHDLRPVVFMPINTLSLGVHTLYWAARSLC